MTTIAVSPSLEHAFVLRSLLEDCGIKAHVPDELNAQNQPFLYTGASTVRLQVEDEDATNARAILTQNGHTPEP